MAGRQQQKQDSAAQEIVEITGYTHEGAGVGRIAGRVVFVPGALQGEQVLVEVNGAKRSQKAFLRGKIIEVLKPSSERIAPACGVFAQCGGCQLQHVNYAAQLQIKEEIVRDTLRRLGGFTEIKVQPVLGMANPWGYRNKGHFQVGRRQGKIKLGFFEEGSHSLVAEPCQHLFSPKVTSLVVFLEDLLTAEQVKVAEAEAGVSGLRYVLLRESHATGEILVVFIYSGSYSDKKEDIAREISRKFPEVVGVCQNKNTRAAGTVLGDEYGGNSGNNVGLGNKSDVKAKKDKGNKVDGGNRGDRENTAMQIEVIWGRDWLEDKIGPFSFVISPASFFQINSVQTAVLYEKVLEFAALTGEEEVVDAYCGIGTISLFLARRARKVTGIEIVPAAVADAQKNAARNGVGNVEFLQGKAEVLLPKMAAQGARPQVVVVDPPRKGCDRALLDSIIEVAPERVVYVSCNPATLARDLRRLVGGGYAICEVQPVDMFPQTGHVESVVLMSRV